VHAIRFSRFKRLLLLAALLLTAAAAGATNLTGTFKHPDGSPVNGKLIFRLSQPARLSDQSAQIVPLVKIFSVTGGQLESGAFIYGNDVLVPSGTYYLVRLVDSNNNLLFEQKWSIQGSSLDLGTLTPTTTGVVFPDPLVKNVTSSQAVIGPVSFNSPVTAFSLTLNGNLRSANNETDDLGTPSNFWREIYVRRWGHLIMPGVSTGLVTAPTAAPNAAVTLSGGSIPDGTYYAKIVYCNLNGCTTASPTRTFTVSGGGGAARVSIVHADNAWDTGAVTYETYVSNDNVNFYRQSSSAGQNTSCEHSTTQHIVNCGSGARVTSFTFSGATPPSSNTATIDGIQVAVNSAMTASGSNIQRAIVLPSGAGTSLTTPLVLRGAKVVCGGSFNQQQNNSHYITHASNWNAPQLGLVMIFSGPTVVEGCNIFATSSATTNAVMLVNAVSGGSHVLLRDNSFRNASTSTSVDALRIKGVWYNLTLEDNYFNSAGKACVRAQGASGSMWEFKGARWDCTGDHHFYSETMPTDPDDNTFTAFPNGTTAAVFHSILFESGKAERFHAINIGFEVRNCQFADPITVGGTSGQFRIGADTYSGAVVLGNVILRANQIQAHSNFGAGVFVASNSNNNLGGLFIENTNFGQTNAVDLNSISLPAYFSGNNQMELNPSSATFGKIINVPTTYSGISAGGLGYRGTSASSHAMQQFAGGIRFTHHARSADERYLFWDANDQLSWYLGNPETATNKSMAWFKSGGASVMRYFQSDGSTALLDVNTSTNSIGVGRTAPSGTGRLGLANNVAIVGRNAAGSAEVALVSVNASDQAQIGDANTPARFPRSSGNAPMVVDSTTEVANLNAERWHGAQAIDFSAALDFGSIAAQSCSELTITATGAAVNNPVAPSWPASLEAGLSGSMYVSATDTLTVRLCNVTSSAIDPASRSYSGRVIK
jgi:hypothetical protein